MRLAATELNHCPRPVHVLGTFDKEVVEGDTAEWHTVHFRAIGTHRPCQAQGALLPVTTLTSGNGLAHFSSFAEPVKLAALNGMLPRFLVRIKLAQLPVDVLKLLLCVR